jgi:hypothetical protein
MRRIFLKGEVLAATGSAFFPQTGGNEKPTPSGCLNEIHLDGSCLFKKVFVNDISDAFLVKNLVIFAWFILNQTQGGPRSASYVVHDTYRGDFLVRFESFFNHLRRLSRNVKHGILLQELD